MSICSAATCYQHSSSLGKEGRHGEEVVVTERSEEWVCCAMRVISRKMTQEGEEKDCKAPGLIVGYLKKRRKLWFLKQNLW